MKKAWIILSLLVTVLLTSCMGGGRNAMAAGGELTGISGTTLSEPAPYGMVLIERGSLKVGADEPDSLWGTVIPAKEISVDAFWMDDTEVTNAEYRQFVYWVRDSIIRERLADPAYGGDETYKIEEDEYGEPVTPHLNWKKKIPWKKPTEDEQRAIESVYKIHPIDGTRMLDASQMNYRYEVFDYVQAALRRNRLNPAERNRNTDVAVNPEEVVMISKDTAYIDEDGRIVRETITRPLTGLHDFLNTYIVNIYPDTTCWVNDFQNVENEAYMRLYFSHPNYSQYPVVGVSWEQANAFCAWRTDYLMKGLGKAAQYIQRYRLPTEVEWEFAARGGNRSKGYQYSGSNTLSSVAWYGGNSSNTTHPVKQKQTNELGLYDMSGNVLEWCYDWIADYSSSSLTNPKGPSTGSNRVLRGGGWSYYAQCCRVADRFSNSPGIRVNVSGLRFAL